MFNQIITTGLYSAILCIFFLKSKFINLMFGDDLMTAFFLLPFPFYEKAIKGIE